MNARSYVRSVICILNMYLSLSFSAYIILWFVPVKDRLVRIRHQKEYYPALQIVLFVKGKRPKLSPPLTVSSRFSPQSTLVMTLYLMRLNPTAMTLLYFHLPPQIKLTSISLHQKIKNFSTFNDVIIKTVCPNGFTCKSTPLYFILRPNSCDNFNAFANYLMENKASFHTFRPCCQSPLRLPETSFIPLSVLIFWPHCRKKDT